MSVAAKFRSLTLSAVPPMLCTRPEHGFWFIDSQTVHSSEISVTCRWLVALTSENINLHPTVQIGCESVHLP